MIAANCARKSTKHRGEDNIANSVAREIQNPRACKLKRDGFLR